MEATELLRGIRNAVHPILCAFCLFGTLISHAIGQDTPATVTEWLTFQAGSENIVQARSAISAFLGKDVSNNLSYVDYVSTGPLDHWLSFRITATEEEFSVREPDSQVVGWALGKTVPGIAAAQSPTDDYHRRLMSKYYQPVDVARMVLATEIGPRTRVFTYQEVATNGTVIVPNQCTFIWDRGLQHLKAMKCHHSPVSVNLLPRLTRAEALKTANAFVAQWPGVTALAVQNGLLGLRDQLLIAPRVSEDEAGVQRLAYEMMMTLKWDRVPEHAAEVVEDGMPEEVPVSVDAHTGACFVSLAQTLWPPAATQDRLSVRIGQRGGYAQLLDMQYQCRLVDQHVYVCAYYLASRLWPGTVEYSSQNSTVSIRYRQREWRCRVTSSELSDGTTVTQAPRPVRLIEEVPYLPWEMIARITGWSLQRDTDALLGRTISLSPPK